MRSASRAASNAAMGAAFSRQFGGGSYGRPSYGTNYTSGGDRPAYGYPRKAAQAPSPSTPPRLVPPAPTRPSSHTPTPGFTPDPVASLQVGQRVEHDRFGFGTILSFDGDGAGLKAVVKFEDGTTKTLLLKFAKLRIAR